jgi:hypothetical protein
VERVLLHQLPLPCSAPLRLVLTKEKKPRFDTSFDEAVVLLDDGVSICGTSWSKKALSEKV